MAVTLSWTLLWYLLTNLQLTPFVTKKMKPTRGRFEGDPKGALSPDRYLARWKMENGED
jgi:large subunit ribosomal protein L41